MRVWPIVLAVSASSLLLVAVLAPPALARPVPKLPPIDGFAIGRVKYGGGGDWYGNKTSLRNLLRALKERTSVKIASEEEVAVEAGSENFFNFPFLWLSGHGPVRFTGKETEKLREHLKNGGFLFADDDYGLEKTFREEMKKIFPDKDLIELPFTHDIYHCFYDLPQGPPKIHEHDGLPPRGYAIVHEGRVVVFFTHEADIGDGLEDAEIHGDPSDKREQAMKMAVNVAIYALTH